ncbi:hypothetical protein MKX01_027149 [Papaver californicum]|nr:hypothetical protein MKX01_027149 [Papaver californicum]
MKHNAEPEAVDLLMEVKDIYQLGEYLDAANYKRTCMYLTSLTIQLPGPDDRLVLDTAYAIYLKFGEYSLAVWVAILLDNLRYVAQVFTICDDIQHKKQLCYILARHGVHFVLDESMVSDDDERGSFQKIINNLKLSEGYVNLAHDNEVMEPKSPEDIYKTLYDDPHVISGALLGVGIVNSSVKHDCDPAMAPLSDYINKKDSTVRAGAIMGLDVAESIIFSSMESSEAELGEPLTRLLPLGLGLLYLGKQESVEATAEVSKTFHEKIRKYCDMTLLSYDYAGTGNVLKIQHILGECGQHLEKELGLDMAIRSLEHMLQYVDQNTRRAVALALGLFCISNPKVNVMDTLSKLRHDAYTEVTMAATISFGLIGADASLLFSVRIAQGLVYMGKGLLTLSPHHSERFLLSPTPLAGLIIMLHTCLDMKSFILGK